MIDNNLLTRKPKDGYGFVYVYYYTTDADNYVGSTTMTLGERAGKYGKNYDKCPGISELIHKVGYPNLTVEILAEVPVEELEAAEATAQDRFNSIEGGMNSRHSSRLPRVKEAAGEEFFPEGYMCKHIKADDSNMIFDTEIYKALFANAALTPTNRDGYYNSKKNMNCKSPISVVTDIAHTTVPQAIANYVLGTNFDGSQVRFGKNGNRDARLTNLHLPNYGGKTLATLVKEYDAVS